MRKSFFFLLLLFAIGIPELKAQYKPLPKDELYIGAYGGLSLGTTSLRPLYVDKAFRMGMNGGVSLRYIAEKHFGLQCGLGLMQAGWKDDYGYGSTQTYERSLWVAELPFLMHAYVSAGAFRFFLNIGPKLGWILAENESYSNVEVSYPYYDKPVETPFQWGVMGEGGLECHVGIVTFGLSGGYYYGLSDYFKNSVSAPFKTSSLQTVTVNGFVFFQVK